MDRSLMKNRAVVAVVGVIAVTVLLSTAYIYATLHWSYSSGERVGYIQKFSKKGWLCKTWEGELTMSPIPGAIPEKFLFTVRDDAVAQLINQDLGRRMSLSYEQHKGVPTACFGESEYFIVRAKSLE
ncbi:MAG: hypothetical protein A2075_07185 [Geobacteraceae bacterium GWC2_58_44]|nr:MAG: hypothetical protein A2075_07185 [Geobacteraceae bacterium GWC2_58_44]